MTEGEVLVVARWLPRTPWRRQKPPRRARGELATSLPENAVPPGQSVREQKVLEVLERIEQKRLV